VLTRKPRNKLVEFIIIQTGTRKGDDVYIEFQFTSQTLNHAGFPCAWFTILEPKLEI
jgi:hypothetical protein